MYKIGIETKGNIVCSAKKFFLKKGYKKTSVNDICLDSGAKPGSFTYFFPKKHDLLGVIYGEYMQRCVNFIDSTCPGLPLAKRHLYTVLFYYEKLYSNEHIVSFHKEVLEMASMNVWFHDTRVLIAGFSGQNLSGMAPVFYDLCIKADNAVRRELNLSFMEKGDYSSEAVKKLLFDIYHVNAKLFDVDWEQTAAYIDDAYDFYLKNKDSDISLL